MEKLRKKTYQNEKVKKYTKRLDWKAKMKIA